MYFLIHGTEAKQAMENNENNTIKTYGLWKIHSDSQPEILLSLAMLPCSLTQGSLPRQYILQKSDVEHNDKKQVRSAFMWVT